MRDKIYVGGGEVDLLIGLDYALIILPGKALRAEEDPNGSSSVAFTRLGCYLFGGLTESSQQTVREILKINQISKLEQGDLKSFFMETFLALSLLHYVFALTNKLLSQHLLNMLRLQLASAKMVGFVFRCCGNLDSQINYQITASEQKNK